jgi:hypothetical protein
LTRGYIEHRLKCVGWKDDPKFQPEAYLGIFHAAGGIPRRINAVCDRLLLSGYLAGQHEFTRDDVEMVAREMHDETVDAPPAASDEQTPATDAARSADPVKLTASRRQPVDVSRLQFEAKSVDEASRLLAKIQSDPIDERLTRLERRADTIVALLQKLLDAVRPQATKKQVKP